MSNKEFSNLNGYNVKDKTAREIINNHSDDIAGLRSIIDNHSGDITGLRSIIDNHSGDIAGLRSDVDSLNFETSNSVVYRADWVNEGQVVLSEGYSGSQLFNDLEAMKNVVVVASTSEGSLRVAFYPVLKFLGRWILASESSLYTNYTITVSSDGITKTKSYMSIIDGTIARDNNDDWEYKITRTGDVELWCTMTCSFESNSLLAGNKLLPFNISNANIQATIMYDASENITAMRTPKCYHNSGKIYCNIYSDVNFDPSKSLYVYLSVKGKIVSEE